ncbi:MAG: pyruvate kinase [Elusimicrobia bacterium]|nr:pyruvate kinase [Elusimicrobiota bacterium]
MTKTKIICTIGPASFPEDVLRGMISSGMDTARLNFSHGKREEFRQLISLIRSINKEKNSKVLVLGDLQGHRIRIGRLISDIELNPGDNLEITQEEILGCPDKISFDYPGTLEVIKDGYDVFIDDGNICLKVVDRTTDSILTEVLVGGILKSSKGVNIPEASLDFGKINAKDVNDLKFCLDQGIELIAQSFVRSADDLLQVREILKDSPAKLIGKIECREGIENIDEIINEADGIMVARGDMGISLPIYEIPLLQKMIIEKCNKASKFVITATQMLESMTENSRPTRAEVSDVANAILDGSDYVMLSGETSIGRYPVETVDMMKKIIQTTERGLV